MKFSSLLPATGADELPRGTGLVLAGVLVALGGALVLRAQAGCAHDVSSVHVVLNGITGWTS